MVSDRCCPTGRHSDRNSTPTYLWPSQDHNPNADVHSVQYYATATARSGGTVTATSLGTAVVESAGNAFAATYGTAIAGNGTVYSFFTLPNKRGDPQFLSELVLGGQATLGFLGFGTAQSGGTIHVGSVCTRRL